MDALSFSSHHIAESLIIANNHEYDKHRYDKDTTTVQNRQGNKKKKIKSPTCKMKTMPSRGITCKITKH